jgi:hypothetical protein
VQQEEKESRDFPGAYYANWYSERPFSYYRTILVNIIQHAGTPLEYFTHFFFTMPVVSALETIRVFYIYRYRAVGPSIEALTEILRSAPENTARRFQN